MGFGFWPGCGCCGPCSACADGGPQQYKVQISGAVNNPLSTAPCTSCANLNGTFILNYLDSPSPTFCRWSLNLPDLCGFGLSIVLAIFQAGPGGPYQMTVEFSLTGTLERINGWSTTLTAGDKPACLSFSSLNVPYSHGVVNAGILCDTSGANCVVTALS